MKSDTPLMKWKKASKLTYEDIIMDLQKYSLYLSEHKVRRLFLGKVRLDNLNYLDQALVLHKLMKYTELSGEEILKSFIVEEVEP